MDLVERGEFISLMETKMDLAERGELICLVDTKMDLIEGNLRGELPLFTLIEEDKLLLFVLDAVPKLEFLVMGWNSIQ